MAITKRLVKGSPLSFQEGDDNLDYLLTNMSGSYISIQGGATSITGSLNAPNITGSLFGTSSWAQNSISSSYPITVTGSNLYSVAPASAIPNNSSGTDNSIFLGLDTGFQSTNIRNSVLIGKEIGRLVDNVDSSNFIGAGAGNYATGSNYSNFIGFGAGGVSPRSQYANFLGWQAGQASGDSTFSIFIGYSAGRFATGSGQSFFAGTSAGENARYSGGSIFIGTQAGYESQYSVSSIFLGYQAGQLAKSASYSTLIGYNAGYNAGSTVARSIGSNNIIIGTNITLDPQRKDSINLGGLIFGTGSYATTGGNPFSGSANGRIGINQPLPQYTLDISGSARITSSVYMPGLTSTNKPNVLTLDTASGQLYYTASSALGSISPIAATGSSLYSINPIAGIPTGDSITGSIFFGELAGAASTGNKHSNFLGYRAGYSSSDADNSTFIGENAGYLSLYSDNSIFIGRNAGAETTSSFHSFFLGSYAGWKADYAFYSNFIGSSAGDSTSAKYSNFIGNLAGYSAINANQSTFIGSQAGYQAGKAEYSIFIGSETGKFATSASFSNFIGNLAGSYARSASYSTLIGYRVGNNIEFSTQIEKPGRGLSSNNIIIGTNISLPDDTKDSINFGGLIFGTGSYATTTGNAFSGSANGRIGINQPLPTQALDVSGSVQISQALILPPTHPLPSLMPTGSIMSSGSNADCKPYFWNGSTWTSMI